MKKAVKSVIKVDTYKIVERAVEEGIRFGLMHARKHTENPSESVLIDHLERDIMNELCEVLIFPDDY